MIGKAIHFNYRGQKMDGEVIDKVMLVCDRRYPETVLVVIATDGSVCLVELREIKKVIL